MAPDLPSDIPQARPLPLAWQLVEAWFERSLQVRVLEDDPASLLAYNLYHHRGREVPLRCGTVIRAGDPLLELHFRREALAPLVQDGDPRRMGLALMQLGDRDVPRLARALRDRPELQEVKAAHALTMFHRGITRYGFEVQPIRERHLEWWFTTWQRILMARDHAEGRKRVRKFRDRLVARHIWASRETLLSRYCAGETERR